MKTSPTAAPTAAFVNVDSAHVLVVYHVVFVVSFSVALLTVLSTPVGAGAALVLACQESPTLHLSSPSFHHPLPVAQLFTSPSLQKLSRTCPHAPAVGFEDLVPDFKYDHVKNLRPNPAFGSKG
ncbi:hypothetical protein EDB92DRAFT_1819644 [Lactarius akahatsu]|uniref:Uncharacterized protein n=1 Tax=Lactarius akahatsu TaxID=416441 RepID=A0AAD4Q9Q2_9AGAM|nr:hypothetical protein EDB92DRAFT_1819644 [Lactarius akahatsu]